MPSYTTLPEGCIKSLKYTLLLTAIDGLQTTEQVVLPGFVKFDPVTKMVTIQSNTGSAKQYSFTLSVTEPKSGVYSSDPYRFVVDVTVVFDPPYFT
jgi:hypothetical protein